MMTVLVSRFHCHLIQVRRAFRIFPKNPPTETRFYFPGASMNFSAKLTRGRPAAEFLKAQRSVVRQRHQALRREPKRASRPASRAVAEQSQEANQQEVGKFISSTPIPAFIPREDLIHQLCGWARIECQESGAVDYGLPMRTRQVNNANDQLWGFIISFLSRDGAVITEIRVMFDDKPVTKHQWVGRGGDGFPTLEGNETTVTGDQLIIRKIDDNPVDDTARTAIKAFCVKLVEAINKYYAFGSCFVDEAS